MMQMAIYGILPVTNTKTQPHKAQFLSFRSTPLIKIEFSSSQKEVQKMNNNTHSFDERVLSDNFCILLLKEIHKQNARIYGLTVRI